MHGNPVPESSVFMSRPGGGAVMMTVECIFQESREIVLSLFSSFSSVMVQCHMNAQC